MGICKKSFEWAIATYHSGEKDQILERNFELEKENGQWLLTKIECDMGSQ